MASSTSTALPSSFHAPLAIVDANNHGAWILICNAFGLTIILITLLVRLYIRLKVSPPFGADDVTLTAGTALAIVQASIVFVQVHEGFGRSMHLISAAKLVTVQKLAYAADIFYIFTLYAFKCCVVLFFKRISPHRGHAMVAWAVLSACLTFAVISVLLVALRCDVSHPWLQYSQTCSGLAAHWKTIAALDISSELAVFAMSIHLVWDLQTSVARKGKVVFAFSLRLLVILIAALRLHYIEKQIASPNPTLVGAIAAILTQIEIFYSAVAATIPCLRPFLAAFVTNYGAMGGDTIMNGSQIGPSQKDPKGSKDSFALRSLDSVKRTVGGDGKSGIRSANLDAENFRPDQVRNQSSVNHGKSHRMGNDASSIGSDQSTKMIIRKKVSWQVDSEVSGTRSQSDMS